MLYKAKLASWIDSFIEYTSVGMSPTIFCKWTALAAIAGVLERKVWVHTLGSNLYPNMYTVLVAPPGVGKTDVTKTVHNLWSAMQGQFTAASSLTSASIVDDLKDAVRTIIIPGVPHQEFHSLKICANELGVLLPAYDANFMNKLTDIYDGHSYGERRRGGEGRYSFTLKHPQINLLAATTPGYMVGTIPDGAWDQGFMSRVIMVFSGEMRKGSLFKASERDKKLFKELEADLLAIGQIYGEVKFSEDAAVLIDNFYTSGGEPAPTHPKLAGYLSRRTAKMLKLMMVCCVNRNEELIITKEDFQLALNIMLEVEAAMPDIFKAMSSGASDGKVIEDAWHYMFTIYSRNKQPVPKAKLHLFLSQRTPAYNIEKVVKTMTESGLLKIEEVNKVGTCYIPKAMDPSL